VALSSEDFEIQQMANKMGAYVIKRPKELAQDDTPMMPVIQDAVKQYEAQMAETVRQHDGDVTIRVDAVVLLDPTNPLRTREDVEGAWKLFQTEGTDCVVSGCESKYNPYFNMCECFTYDYIQPLWDTEVEMQTRQQAPRVFQIDTTVWIYGRKAVEDGRRIPERTRLYLVPPERSASIDTELDWEITEFLYRRKK
jgi:CMP-N-acetylneuraminic acid synthetase